MQCKLQSSEGNISVDCYFMVTDKVITDFSFKHTNKMFGRHYYKYKDENVKILDFVYLFFLEDPGEHLVIKRTLKLQRNKWQRWQRNRESTYNGTIAQRIVSGTGPNQNVEKLLPSVQTILNAALRSYHSLKMNLWPVSLYFLQ